MKKKFICSVCGYIYEYTTELYKKFVTPDILSDKIAQNFISLIDGYYYGSKSIINSANISSSSFVGSEFSFVASGNDPFVVLGYQLLQGRKYAVYFDIVADQNYSLYLKTGTGGSWVQVITSVTQTSGVHATNTIFFDCETEAYFAIDSKSILSGTTVSGTIKIYDITDAPENAKDLDYSALGPDVYTLNVKQSVAGVTDTHLVGKKVVFYGDSITAQKKYPVLVQQYYGFTMVNAGVGGARISYARDIDMSSDTRISALPTDADIVFVMGGTNDWGKIEIEGTLTYNNGFDRTKFKGGLAYIIQKIQERCPNAKIIVATLIGGRNETRQDPDPVTQYLPEADTYGQTDLDFRNAEIEVANTLNIQVCDTWSCGINGMNADIMIADTVHPTDAGAKLIAEYIIGFLKSIILQ